ncbi:PAS domain-containing protein [Cryobacterium frigoriphilum]|uniref:histidine kinase n=1 Tax=Cryobacterium frigoriphilum TaxID=1259150 RepID=A0A4R9A1G1_9MICO|nr:ATP-binding protein [Cryobacterium frigoriphilum]TFD50212.1 PAS domain-containing protein [Cryobacterium frigoriphilum]
MPIASPAPVRRTPFGRSRFSLTRQLLMFQLILIALVLLAVTAISVEQSRTGFASQAERRMLAVAEYTAANPLLRSLLSADDVVPQQLTAPVESLRTTTGVDQLIVTDAAGRVIASPADPRLLGTTLVPGRADTGTNGAGGAWGGEAPLGTKPHVLGQVPVISNSGGQVATIIAGREIPELVGLLAAAAPNLLTYLGVAAVLGIAGSLLLAARVKRQTLGLEPDQIARLVEHREAMIHGIREGIIAVDADGIITLVNDSARSLLGLPGTAEGSRIDEVGLEAAAVQALSSHGIDDHDSALVNGGVLLVLNQTTIHPPRGRPEVVTTLRDRTELVTLQHDLGSSRQATDTLRAQTHEFANRLHTISMLMQLGDPDAAVEYIDAVTRERTELDNTVLTRVQEPAVAALLIAKTSLARERGAELTLTGGSALPRVDAQLSTDLVTVLGNLIDNALDAVGEVIGGAEVRLVEVDVREVDLREVELPAVQLPAGELPAESAVRVTVRDTGPGIDTDLLEHVFDVGVTSKPVSASGSDHGYGLAIVRLVTTRRGGQITYQHEHGAVFEAILPTRASSESGRQHPSPKETHV